jgi:hypothetical protein
MIRKRVQNNNPISYAITVHNEDKSLTILIDRIYEYIRLGDEVVFLDDYSDNPRTLTILSEHKNVHKRKLNLDFSAQKNYLNSKCKCNYIFQLDADELPTRKLLTTIPSIIEKNPRVDLFWFPRQNQFSGATSEHIKRWNWKLDSNGNINYPDYQGRLYKNNPRIRWGRRLHERILGCSRYTLIPTHNDLDIIHSNPVEKQVRSNENYIKYFSTKEVNGK